MATLAEPSEEPGSTGGESRSGSSSVQKRCETRSAEFRTFVLLPSETTEFVRSNWLPYHAPEASALSN
jgi:hypothetical protein